MTSQLPVVPEPTDFEIMRYAISDMLEDGIDPSTIYDLTVIAEDADQFDAGAQASIELMDIVKDHYQKDEPDNGSYDEEDKNWTRLLPPPEWFEDDDQD